VEGFINYSDNLKFVKKYNLSIFQILDEFKCDCGKLENKPSTTDETQYLNWLSSIMREIISFSETEN
tara:strand:- start:268 stop:468 length:201 start_codon:yes stop_codon:yes gene_type:complete